MGLAAHIEPLKGELPRIPFRWDPETEILSGEFKLSGSAKGLTGSIELAGSDGSFVLLDVESGALRGVEVVVWPESDIVDGLTPPAVDERGRLIIPSRASQPGIAAVEVNAVLSARRSADESVIHLRSGPYRSVKPVHLADNLIAEIDGAGEIAGFWLLNVPPFPKPEI